MAPLMKERFQGIPRTLRIKLLVTLVGVVCVSVIFLTVTPIHAASVSIASHSVNQSSGRNVSGGGCTKLGVEGLTVCVGTNERGQVVSKASVNISSCPTSVTIRLQDNRRSAELKASGCGSFVGPALSILQGKDTYTAQVVACFSNDPEDCEGIASPNLNIS